HAGAVGGGLAPGESVDYQPGSRIRPQKNARDRLMRLAQAHPDWALGFEDEVWWSRLVQPSLHSWAGADAPLRLLELTRPLDDRAPKALACYGVLVRRPGRPKAPERMLLR